MTTAIALWGSSIAQPGTLGWTFHTTDGRWLSVDSDELDERAPEWALLAAAVALVQGPVRLLSIVREDKDELVDPARERLYRLRDKAESRARCAAGREEVPCAA